MSAVAPAPTAARQHVVDRLRGFALLGVLVVNTPFLITSVEGTSDASMPTALDRGVGYLTWALFQAKSYVLFSFLFGYSLTIFLERAAARGADAGRAYPRRLLGLALFGIAHAVLLFVGDILFVYAVLGAALIVLRRCSDRVLLRLAGGLFALQVVVLGTAMVLAATAGGDDLPGGTAAIDRSWGEDGLVGSTLTRLEVWPFAFVLILVLQGCLIMSLFCVGMVAGRRRWLADVDRHRDGLRRLRRWGLLLGLPPALVGAALVVAPGAGAEPVRLVLGVAVIYLTAPVLSAGYIAAIALLRPGRFVRLAEADGTMSLTIYLGESLLMTTLAAGWGFGLFGLATAPAVGVAFAVWLALSVFATLWHRRFGQGPAERLLRAITYGRSRWPAPERAGADALNR